MRFKSGANLPGVTACLALTMLVGGTRVLSAATSATWVDPTSGAWNDATRWSTNPIYPNNGQPSPGDTYNVSFPTGGLGYTVALDAGATGDLGVDSLALSQTSNLSIAHGKLAVTAGTTFNGGSISLDAAALHAGIVSGAARIEGANGASLLGAFNGGLEIGGEIRFAEYGTFGVVGELSLNAAQLQIEEPRAFVLFAGASNRITGVGEIVFAAPASGLNYPRLGPLGGRQIDVDPDITIRDGNGGFRAEVRVGNNRGTISAQTPGSTIELRVEKNLGLIVARDGGRFFFAGPTTSGALVSGGRWQVLAGSEIATSGAGVTNNPADVLLSGDGSIFAAINTLQSNSGRFGIDQGRDFATVGSLNNTGTLFTGGGSALAVNGGLTMSSAAAWECELGKPDNFGQITAAGTAQLGGTLRLLLQEDFVPKVGDEFALLQADAVNGMFSSIDFPDGLDGNLIYSPTGVTVLLTSVPEPCAAIVMSALVASLRRRRIRPLSGPS